MIQQNAPCGAAVHEACIRIARKCVWVIQAVLREEERRDALEAFYLASREVLDKANPPSEK